MGQGKILLALQFWNGDKEMAMRLARMIARNERRHSNEADFLFVARHDSSHDRRAIADVSQRFNTHVYTSRRCGTGWPHGCNDLWFATMEWVMCMQEGKKTNYKAVLTFEADCVPLVQNWITVLSDEWDKAGKKVVMGAMQSQPWPHINGNAMFSTDSKFLHWLVRKVSAVPARSGWDCHLANEFQKRGWANCNKMQSLYQMPTLPGDAVEDMLKLGVAFLHGVKDDSVLSYREAKIRTEQG